MLWCVCDCNTISYHSNILFLFELEWILDNFFCILNCGAHSELLYLLAKVVLKKMLLRGAGKREYPNSGDPNILSINKI